MQRIIVILGLTLFTLTSCIENKAETKKVEVATTDKITFSNYTDLNESINYTKEFDLYWLRDLEEVQNGRVSSKSKLSSSMFRPNAKSRTVKLAASIKIDCSPNDN